jgi:hypothetical protein
MGNDYRSPRGPDRSRAVLMRDAALARVGRTRRWVIVAAAALTAGIAALVSAVAPGRSLASKTSSASAASTETASTSGAGGASSSSSSIPAMPPPASAGDLGLQSPDQAPAPDDQSQAPSAPPQSAQPQPAPQPQTVPAAPPSSGVVSGGS